MSRSVLVVGGAGYIGSHMTKCLIEAGHDVTVFDNLSRGHRDAVQTKNFVQGDLLKPQDLTRVFASGRFDIVMHFAAFAYVGESMSEPVMYYENNVAGTLKLLAAMRQADADRLVFSSTCATYGVPTRLPITEDHAQQPINPYGRSKWMVEQILEDCAAAYGLNSVSLRYFNAAGCAQDGSLGERHDPETHLIPLVLQEALRVKQGGNPNDTRLCVFGDDFPTLDGTCVRDYVHVEDLCSAHLLAAKQLMDGELSGVTAFNLGNGDGFSVKQVIDVCREVTGVDIQYRVQGRRPGDPPALVGGAQRAREKLGWVPRYTELRDIVETAWRWMCHPR